MKLLRLDCGPVESAELRSVYYKKKLIVARALYSRNFIFLHHVLLLKNSNILKILFSINVNISELRVFG